MLISMSMLGCEFISDDLFSSRGRSQFLGSIAPEILAVEVWLGDGSLSRSIFEKKDVWPRGVDGQKARRGGGLMCNRR